MQLVDIGALAGAKTQMVQADAALLERGARMLGSRRMMPTAVRPPAQ